MGCLDREDMLTGAVAVLDPIPTKGLTSADVDQLTRDTREKMLDTIMKFSQDAESRSVANKGSKGL
jgi:hypothetical protein